MNKKILLVGVLLNVIQAQASGCDSEEYARGCVDRIWHHCYPMDGCTDIVI